MPSLSINLNSANNSPIDRTISSIEKLICSVVAIHIRIREIHNYMHIIAKSIKTHRWFPSSEIDSYRR